MIDSTTQTARIGPPRRSFRMAPDSLTFTVFLGALSALPPLSIDMGLPAIPEIEHGLAHAMGRGALTLSLFLAGFAVSPLCCGPLADRFGRRATILAGLVAFALAAAAGTLAQSFALLLLCRLAQGVAAGACVVMPLAIVRDAFDGSSARHHLSRITAVVGIAPMLAPILGGWVMAIGGWRAIYATQAILGLVLLAVTLIAFEETLPVSRRRSLNPSVLVASYAMVLRDQAFRGYTLGYACAFACMFSFIASAPAVLMGRMGLSPGIFALVFGLSSCGTLLGSLAAGRFNARGLASAVLIRRGVIVMVTAALVLLAVAFVSASSGAIAVIAIVLPVTVMIFCFGLISPSANHEALRRLPEVAGSASGVLRCTQMVLGALASALVALAQPFGQPVLVMAMLMLAASLSAGLVLLRVTSRSRAPMRTDLGELS